MNDIHKNFKINAHLQELIDTLLESKGFSNEAELFRAMIRFFYEKKIKKI